VLQGERKMAGDNRTLGKFSLVGIPPAPRGVPQIEVIFDIDANGIVNVSAKDKATGKEQKITITASSGLSETDIQRMVDDAKAHEEEDNKRRQEVENRNQLDATILQMEKLLAENGDKLPADAKTEVESALADAKSALDSNQPDQVKAAQEKLTAASHKLASAMYGQGQPGAEGFDPSAAGEPAGGATGSSPGGGAGSDDVIDAEFEEKN
jgi:molecular chaperone DnaK